MGSCCSKAQPEPQRRRRRNINQQFEPDVPDIEQRELAETMTNYVMYDRPPDDELSDGELAESDDSDES